MVDQAERIQVYTPAALDARRASRRARPHVEPLDSTPSQVATMLLSTGSLTTGDQIAIRIALYRNDAKQPACRVQQPAPPRLLVGRCVCWRTRIRNELARKQMNNEVGVAD